MQSQDRQKRVSEIESFLKVCEKADRAATELVREKIRDLLKRKFSEEKTRIIGGLPGITADSLVAIGGTLLKNKHPFFDAIGETGRKKLSENQQKISKLEQRLDEAVKRIDSIQPDQLLRTANILCKYGLDTALDYIATGKLVRRFTFRPKWKV